MVFYLPNFKRTFKQRRFAVITYQSSCELCSIVCLYFPYRKRTVFYQTYKKLNGKWVEVSSTQTLSLEGKTIKEETRNDNEEGCIYFLSDTTGAAKSVYDDEMQTFKYEFKPSTKTLILTYDYNSGRRALYKNNFTVNSQIQFIDDNTFSMSYTFYESLTEYELVNYYDCTLDEDERNEEDEYLVRFDMTATYKRITE